MIQFYIMVVVIAHCETLSVITSTFLMFWLIKKNGCMIYYSTKKFSISKLISTIYVPDTQKTHFKHLLLHVVPCWKSCVPLVTIPTKWSLHPNPNLSCPVSMIFNIGISSDVCLQVHGRNRSYSADIKPGLGFRVYCLIPICKYPARNNTCRGPLEMK